MPVFPWRFIDSLLGRSRPGDDQPATEADIEAEVTRLTDRLGDDVSIAQHLDDHALADLRSWSGTMLRRRAPAADGRSRRDVNVQLGAVNGAIRAVIRTIDEALVKTGDPADQRLASRLRALESEIASPLYPADEQTVVRSRLERALQELGGVDSEATPASVVRQLVAALTPPDR